MTEIHYQLIGHSSFRTEKFQNKEELLQNFTDNPAVFKFCKNKLIQESDFVFIEIINKSKESKFYHKEGILT